MIVSGETYTDYARMIYADLDRGTFNQAAIRKAKVRNKKHKIKQKKGKRR